MAQGEDSDRVKATDFVRTILEQQPTDDLAGQAKVQEIRSQTGNVRALMLQMLAERLTMGRADPRRRGIDANQVRKWMTPWDAMLICCDLSIPNDAGSNSRSVVDRRMEAVVAEAFHWSKEILFAEITLFSRDTRDGDASAEQEQGADIIIPVRHCYAVRRDAVRLVSERQVAEKPAKGAKAGSAQAQGEEKIKPKDRLQAIEDQLAAYRGNLASYVENHGTSITQEGHVSRDPRAATPGKEGIPLRSIAADASVADVRVFPPKDEKLKVPVAVVGSGSDSEYVRMAVNPALGISLTGDCLIHFMEGIDQDFHDKERRKGTVAHMFLVFEDPASKLSTAAELTRNIQTLLLRFCAYYMADQAEELRQKAERQSQMAQAREDEIRQERNNLSSRAREVKESIEKLQQAALMLQTHLVDNPLLDRFGEWIRQLKPLLKTDEVFPNLPHPIRVVGDHQRWGREQLAAALWAYAQPEVPSWFNTERGNMLTLWDTASGSWTNDIRRNKPELYTLSRIGTFKGLADLDEEQLRLTFWAFKRWHKLSVQGQAQASDSRYRLGQIMFLLGGSDFNKFDAGQGEFEDHEFEFPKPHMLEGLIRFTNAIARGFIEIEKNKSLDRVDIVGGVVPHGIKVSLVDGKELGEGWGAVAGCLEVRIMQHPLLAERKGKSTKDSYMELMEAVRDRGQPPDKDLQAWNRRWTEQIGSKETSTAAAQAMGCSTQYYQKRNFGDDEKSAPAHARIWEPQTDLDLSSWVESPDAEKKELVARMEISVDTNEFIFTIKPRVRMEEFH